MLISNIPIHIINLKHRIDRKEKLIAELKKHNIENYSFVNAIDGSVFDFSEIIDESHRKLTKGECGCYLSHFNIYKSILESDSEIHLILEDDVFFVHNFKMRFNTLLNKVKDVEWDIFYLGINCYEIEGFKGHYIGRRFDGIYYPDNPLWGTHGYLIKKETVKKIFNLLMPITLPIDVFLMGLDIKRLTLCKTIIKTPNADSDTR